MTLLLGTIHKDVICDINNIKGEQSFIVEILHAIEVKLVSIRTRL